jgi:hypothetical protein
MAQRAGRRDPGDPRGEVPEPRCATEWEHAMEIAGPGNGASVSIIALTCPSCAGESVTDELGQIVAARRRTLAGVARLPAGIRAGLAAAGTLDQLHEGTVAEVREAVERCRSRLGVEPPARLVSALRSPAPDWERVLAVLDAASEWLATLAARQA